MDGLSAAASGMAVISLAVQLVSSVRDIRRFLRQVSEAPKELKRLIDLLGQLEQVLQIIGEMIENQQKSNGIDDIDVSPCVFRAIETCESKVAVLASVVETARRRALTTRRATRTLESLRLACKKWEIQECESQMLDTVSLLNLAMTANLTTVYSKSSAQLLSKVINTNRIADTITDDLFLLRRDPASRNSRRSIGVRAGIRKTDESFEASRASKISGIRTATFFSSYCVFFGKLFHRKTIQSTNLDEDDENLFEEPHTKSESSWLFVLSFLSACINYQYVNACGFIQRSIRIYTFLPYDHPIWQLCVNGNLKSIQKIFSTGQVSPFSIDRWGDTLLHKAAIKSNVETCRFLLDLGLNAANGNNYGRQPCMWLLQGSHDLPDFMDTKALFTSRCDDIDITEYCHNLFSQEFFQPTVEMFNDLVKEFVSEETVNKFRESPLRMGMRMLWNSDSALYGEWKKALCHIIGLGADLHKGHRSGVTLLDDVMNLESRPFESINLGKEWLDVLSKSNVDVLEYLRTEVRLHSEALGSLPMLSPDFMSDHRPHYLVVSDKIPSVSWEWYIDREGPAFNLLEEFKDFGPTGSHYSSVVLSDEEDEQTEEEDELTEEEDKLTEEENVHWPLCYSVWQDPFRWQQDPVMLNLERIAKARFENHERKKAKKLAKSRGIRMIPKVPGSWID